MRPLIAVGLGAALLLLALAIEAPATLVDGRLDAASAGRLRLTGATGTVWNGSGELRLLPEPSATQLAWQVDPWPLLWGELRGTLGTEDKASPRASFAVAGGDFSLRDVRLTLPADALLRASGAPAILAPAGGNIAVRADTFTRRGDNFEGRADVRWDGASLPGARPDDRIALGDVRFDAAGQGKDIAGTLSNVGGDVEIIGTAAVSASGAGPVDVVLRPRGGIDPERAKLIAGALATVGRPDGSGGFRIVWQEIRSVR
jgi:general secretion pathway protein N